MVNKFLKRYWLTLLGVAVGAIGGYLYWLFIGCSSGSCPITSSPTISSLWGAAMGGLLFDMFKKRRKNKMNNILRGWDAARIIRLVAGVGIAVYAIASKDYLFLWLAGLFLFQAVLNISCCGAGGCWASAPSQSKPKYDIKEYKK